MAWPTLACARSRLVQSTSTAAFSAVGTSRGLTSYAEIQVTSSWTGSGAISTGVVVMPDATSATRDRRLRDPPRLLGRQHDAGGEPPGTAVDHAHREPEVLGVARGLEDAVADAEVLVADPLEPEVGVGRAELAGPAERDVPEVAVGEGGEGRVEAGSAHGANLSEPLGCSA